MDSQNGPAARAPANGSQGTGLASDPQIPPGSGAALNRRLSVLLVTEGTYPFHWGGVSTWCHLLIRDLPDVNFTLLSIVAYPHMEPLFIPPPNVVAFHPVPLWGVLEALESRSELTLGEIRRRRASATESVVTQRFLPVFEPFLTELLTDDNDPARFGQLIHQMYRYFLAYDYDTTLRSQAVWRCFGQTARQHFPAAAAQLGYADARFALADVTWAMKWLYHWLFPLSEPIPETDVVHAAMTGTCALVAAAAKHEYGAPFMLTEHGIYLRERYLAEAPSSENLFLKLFKLRYARRTTELGYVLADLISPCCDYNQRWEYRNGANREQIQTIYYGADDAKFVPTGKPIGDPPVVVWVGRINPLKDVLTLLRAAAIVHQTRPDIEFRLFGSPPAGDEPYYEQCLALRAELGLERGVTFAGYTANTAEAYNQGDVAILSSVSEGFPFSTLEAMLCGKPVVATAVGGVPEQIEGCGIAVEPRNPAQLATAVLAIMNDPTYCAALGEAARVKAVEAFSVRQSGAAHRASYASLVSQHATSPEVDGIGRFPSGNGSQSTSAANGAPVAPGSSSLPQGAVASTVVTTAGNATFRAHGAGPGHGMPSVPNGARRMDAGPAAKTAPRIISPGEPRASEAANSALLAALVDEIEERVPRPIDALEITAVLESLGITDDIAAQHYGMDDTFALAATILRQIHPESRAALDESPTPEVSFSRREALLDYARGPMALVPGIVLLLFIQFCAVLSGWSGQEVLALSLGLTCSMVITSGIVQAVMRRASVSLSMGNLAAANRFLRLSLGWSLALVALLGVLALAAMAWLGVFTGSEALIFALAFVGLSAVWLPAAALTVVRAQWWLGIGLAAGLLAGITAALVLGPSAEAVLPVSIAIGFGVTLGLVLGAVYYKLGKSAPGSESQRATLPAVPYMIHEAAPYFAFGSLYMIFILTPHVIGWIDAARGGMLQWGAITSLELGLTLSLPPIMIAGGVIEHALRIFWRRALAVQSETPAGESERFREALKELYRRQLGRYLVALTLVSAGVLAMFQISLSSGRLESWFGIASPVTLSTVFYCGLIAYALVGWGLFNSTFSITLNLPGVATRGIVAGIIVAALVGLLLAVQVDYRYTVISFIVGALVFVVVSSANVTRLLRSADYHYFASF
ncbi:MAG: GT4 family glycosyltransferase PelF [Anaerolineae bacterium]